MSPDVAADLQYLQSAASVKLGFANPIYPDYKSGTTKTIMLLFFAKNAFFKYLTFSIMRNFVIARHEALSQVPGGDCHASLAMMSVNRI
jgi:hypothetical protein